ncbi:MAG TPA: hypothetical protein VGS19_11030 [Streptosporangiaceae bacterium]|nr:hypothetical protein [Streptosporangiaceae bacterium]
MPYQSAASASTAVANTIAPMDVPSSPDGIYDWRLCGWSNFDVFDGTYDHNFIFQGATYVNGGIQHNWKEYVWWGPINVGAYTLRSFVPDRRPPF